MTRGMISIIVLSYRPVFLENMLNSVTQTIGDCRHELIAVENSAGAYSICEAYNMATQKANGEFCCFVHEDVIFQSRNWGPELLHAMEVSPRLGLIGVIGSSFKSAFPTGWYNAVRGGAYHRGGIVQGLNSFDDTVWSGFSPSLPIENVVCLDGVFLFTRTALAKRLKFDEGLLSGYHGYDIDFSLQVYFAGYELAILKSIRLLHYSLGNPDERWTEANRLVSEKWRQELPACCTSMGRISLLFLEFCTRYGHAKGTRLRRLKYAAISLLCLCYEKMALLSRRRL